MTLTPDHPTQTAQPAAEKSCCPALNREEVDAIEPASLPQGCTMRDVLKESIGCYIVCQHLLGSSSIVFREGLLTRVESNCYTLHDEDDGTDITCDYFSLKMFQRFPGSARPAVKISRLLQDLELAGLQALGQG